MSNFKRVVSGIVLGLWYSSYSYRFSNSVETL